MNCGLLTRIAGAACIILGSGLADAGLAVTFVPPDEETAPVWRDAGVSRRGLRFIPPADNTSPQRTASGASRVGFIPPPNHPAPQKTASGASRQANNGDNHNVSFIPPPHAPAPQRTASGASRDGEIWYRESEGMALLEGAWQAATMVAVTPANAYGLTVSPRPTVMAYVPQSTAHTAVFSLKDDTHTVVYRRTVPLDRGGGILKVNLPDDAPALVPGNYYHWFITLQSESYITPGSPYVDGWVKWIEPTAAISHAMADQDGLAKARMLAESGIWYDAAAQLASLQTQEHRGNWTEFLRSVGLDALVDHSFL